MIRGVVALAQLIARHVSDGNRVVLVTHQDVAIEVPRQQHIELTGGPMGSDARAPAVETAC